MADVSDSGSTLVCLLFVVEGMRRFYSFIFAPTVKAFIVYFSVNKLNITLYHFKSITFSN